MLVREFLQDSALKVLPQNHFEDAVMAYVNGGDKDTMDAFINESLSKSMKFLTSLEGDDVLGDLDGNIERCKEELQARWSKSEGKWTQKKKLKPKPDDWDSDLNDHWDDPNNPDRWVQVAKPAAAAAKPKSRARRSTGDGDIDMDDDSDMFVANVSDSDPPARPARGPGSRGGRGGAKKAAPVRKAPARAPPKKKGPFLVDSDDEEEEDEQDDSMSIDPFLDEDEDEAPVAAPKRGSRAAPAAKAKAMAAPAKRTPTPRAAAKPVASRGKQSKLNFSQSQRPTSSRVNATQQSLTISDDEIDDDDDDGFEPVVPARGGRR